MTADLDHLPITILGAGLIGIGWAALFAHHGARVTLWDPQPEALKTAPDRLAKPCADLTELDGHSPRGDISYESDLATALREPALIQENAPESIPVKHALYAEIETLAAPEAILASSTSSLTWDDLAPGLTNPQRLITAHPFNPPHLVPLVELYGPDPARLDRAEALYRPPVASQSGSTFPPPAISPTGSPPPSGARRCISSPRASPMSRRWTAR